MDILDLYEPVATTISSRTNNKSIEKPKSSNLMVGILVVSPFITEKTIKGFDGKDKKIYSGFVYEIWELIKKLNKWQDKVTEVTVELNYDKVVDDLAAGKYDIVIANYWVFGDRLKRVLFTRSIFISKIVAVFKPSKSRIETILSLGITYFIFPLLIIILLGLLFGYGLYKLEKERGFRASIRTATATFFGEAGYLFENSSLTVKGLLYIYFVMTIAYFFNLVLQGLVTTDIMSETAKKELNVDNIRSSKPLIVSHVFDLGEVMEKHGGVYKSLKISIPDIPKTYLANTDKYAGYLTEYEAAKNDILEYNELQITQDVFGFKENSFIIHKSRADLKKEIDLSIVKLHHVGTIGEICKKYMTNEDALYCVL